MTTKFVRFDEWCSKCKYEKVAADDDPCNDCLTVPVNIDSTKPVKFKEKDD